MERAQSWPSHEVSWNEKRPYNQRWQYDVHYIHLLEAYSIEEPQTRPEGKPDVTIPNVHYRPIVMQMLASFTACSEHIHFIASTPKSLN